MAVITINGEYGSGTREVGKLVAEKMKYEFIERHLLAQIAEKLNISENEAMIFEKTLSSRIIRYIDRYTCTMVQKVVDGEYGCLDDDKYYDATKSLVEELYEAGNVTLIGWGSQCLLAGKPDTFHVRLTKSEDQRVKSVMNIRGINEANAKKIMKKEDADSEAYIKHYFDKDWNDARLYNLVVDTGKTEIEKAAGMICDNVKNI